MGIAPLPPTDPRRTPISRLGAASGGSGVLPQVAPSHFGRYEVLGPIGRGGMGAVWLARDPALDREVAVKVLERADRLGETARVRFLREARNAGQLRHPGIVRVYEVTQTPDGTPYIVMEYVRGRTFAAILANEARDRSSRDHALSILEEVARTLHVAHGERLVHRDVKPENIIVDEAGQARVLDFGLSKSLDPGAGHVTQDGTPLGTPLYMAPEQVRGRLDEITARTDIYALGVILYQVLTGALPYQASSLAELCQKIIDAAPRRPRERNPRVPRELERVWARAVAKDPAERYPTAEAFADDLRDARAAPGTAAADRRRTAGSRSGPSPGLVVAGSMVVVLALVAIVVVAFGRPDRSSNRRGDAIADAGSREETPADAPDEPDPAVVPVPEPEPEPEPDEDGFAEARGHAGAAANVAASYAAARPMTLPVMQWSGLRPTQASVRETEAAARLREQAESHLAALESGPGIPAPVAAMAARAGAMLALHDGRIERARSLVESSLTMEPDNLDGVLLRGLIRMRSNELDGACADLDRVAARVEADVSHLFWRGLAWHLRGGSIDLATAVASYDRAVALQPEDAIIAGYRGHALARLVIRSREERRALPSGGQPIALLAEACGGLASYVDARPDDRDGLLVLSWTRQQLAAYLEANGKLDEAKTSSAAAATDADRAAPDDRAWPYGLCERGNRWGEHGRLLTALGETAAADDAWARQLAAYEAALRHAPEHLYAYVQTTGVHLGRAKRLLGRGEDPTDAARAAVLAVAVAQRLDARGAYREWLARYRRDALVTVITWEDGRQAAGAGEGPTPDLLRETLEATRALIAMEPSDLVELDAAAAELAERIGG